MVDTQQSPNTEHNDVLLEIKGLKKYYPVKKGFFKRTTGYVKAVDSVDFFIHSGETFGLVGESGCGKTTIGKTLLRLVEATGGEMLFNGQDFFKLSREELRQQRRHIQMIFQDPYGSLNPRMTVGQLIGEPMAKHGIVRGRENIERAKELMEIVGLNPKHYRRYSHEFSGGQRQRIGVARALSLNPRLIVCDEPVSALDVSIQSQILNLLDDLQKQFGVAYLFIAHGMAAVRHISARVGVMYLGKIVEIAKTDYIFDECMHPYTQALMSAIPIPEVTGKREHIILQGEVPNPLNPPSGCRFHPRCVRAKAICRRVQPDMTEIKPDHFVACHAANGAG
jgi:oligopeptide/dipeptide ABC transporter ATP-binding protein